MLTRTCRLAVEPDHAWFVGDTLTEDMAGAAAAGLQPIWLRSLLEEPPPAEPEIQVDDWSVLARLYDASQSHAPLANQSLNATCGPSSSHSETAARPHAR